MARENKMYASITDTFWTALLIWRTMKWFYRMCLYLLTTSLLLLFNQHNKVLERTVLNCANLIVSWLKSQEIINFVCFNKFNPSGSFHLQIQMFNST